MYQYKDVVFIKANAVSKEYKRILIDSGSSFDIVFKATLDKMDLKIKP